MTEGALPIPKWSGNPRCYGHRYMRPINGSQTVLKANISQVNKDLKIDKRINCGSVKNGNLEVRKESWVGGDFSMWLINARRLQKSTS